MLISVYHTKYLKNYFKNLNELVNISKQKRGKEFENFMKIVFELSGYNVKKTDDITEYGEQIDLHVYKEKLNILVECKWYKESIGLNMVESFAFRIQKRDPTTIGLFIAVKGVSPSAKKFSIHLSDRLLLFLDRNELLKIIEGNLDLEQLIHKKIRYLQRGDIFTFGESDENQKLLFPPTYPSSSNELVFKKSYLENSDIRIMVGSTISFVRDIFQPFDKKNYKAYSFYPKDNEKYYNMHQNVGNVLSIFNAYYKIFGFSKNLSFGINQEGINWSGFGINNFFKNLFDQNNRYLDKNDLYKKELIQVVDFWYDRGILNFRMESDNTDGMDELFDFNRAKFTFFLINQQDYLDRIENFSSNFNLAFKETEIEIEIEEIEFEGHKKITLIEPTLHGDEKEDEINKNSFYIGGIAENPFFKSPTPKQKLNQPDPLFSSKNFLESLKFIYCYAFDAFKEDDFDELFVEKVEFIKFYLIDSYPLCLINFVINW